MLQSKENIIAKLRQDITAWEGFRAPQTGDHRSLGLGPLDQAFPNAVLPTGTVHEFISTCPEETAASGAFITGLLGLLLKSGGACLWISWSRRRQGVHI